MLCVSIEQTKAFSQKSYRFVLLWGFSLGCVLASGQGLQFGYTSYTHAWLFGRHRHCKNQEWVPVGSRIHPQSFILNVL